MVKTNANDNLKVEEEGQDIPLLGEINFKVQIENEDVTRDEMVEEI